VTATGSERLHRRALKLEWFTVGWNVIEALVAIGAGVIAGSVALIGFGADSFIEVISAVALLWRLRRAGPGATEEEHGSAERQALFLVSVTFFLLAIYIAYESVSALIRVEEPESSMVGLILSVLSLVVMPLLAVKKQRTAREMGSDALQADAVETWVCAYLSLALLVGVGLHAAFGLWWADPVAATAMIPVILWQGWETRDEARG
jgi:cation diffusion facilitator family transporter